MLHTESLTGGEASNCGLQATFYSWMVEIHPRAAAEGAAEST
jgi:hypothetical protein